ncbi:DUF169 domain-containing protein [Clostridium sediminicola]|uniref:DUF169 domain-containing protein n=1 Tax=Clostridium sediminicola TaxID=3114879 RepID=UPI0031F2373A
MNYKELSEQLNSILKMKHSAVGIKLLTENESLDGYDSSTKYTFCQFIMKAREGSKLLANGDNIACANGASALGFMPVPDKLMSGEFLSTIGSFQREAGKKTMELMPRFEQNQYTGIALSPLEDVDFDPDIIVLETLPEQIMWLNLASIHQTGGRLNFSTSVSNGTCVDMTVVPHLTGGINVSTGCYGCRNATNVADEYLYAGFPGSQLESIVNSLALINEKAMPRTREKRAYNRLIKK